MKEPRKCPRHLALTTAGAALFFLTSVSTNGAGRAFEDIAPKIPKKNQGEVVDNAPAKGSALGGDEVVVGTLRGVVLVSQPGQVRPAGISDRHGVYLGHTTFARNHDLTQLVEGYLNRRATLNSLAALTRSIVAYYRAHDRPVVNVYVPQQNVVSSTIQIVVLESRIGKIDAQGARFFSNHYLRAQLTLREDEPIQSSQLSANVDWLNANPFLQSDLRLAPGDTPGTTDVLLHTTDTFPLRVYAGYEDSGEAVTGFDRYLAGFNYGNLFGLAQQLNYQFTTSGDGESLRAHSASYVVPLPWHNTLTLFGSYVETKGSIPPLIGLRGSSYQISGRYNIPLPSFQWASLVTYKHDLAGGFDHKYNDNTLIFGATPLPDTLYDVNQFVLSYTGTETDPYGQITLDDELYLSPGDLGDNNSNAAFTRSRAGSNSEYAYNVLFLQRLTKLPYDWTLLLRGTLQNSTDNLPPSEQIGFGGYDTVRGYDEREVNTDEGYIFTTELRSPPVKFGQLLNLPAFKDQLQFLGFWDYAAASNHDLLPGEAREIPLSGIGAGVRYTINTYLSVRYDYGFQLLRTGLDRDHGSRSDLGIVLSY